MQHIAVPDADNSLSVLNLTDNTVTASAGGHADEGGDGLLWNGTTPAAAAPQIPATAPVPDGRCGRFYDSLTSVGQLNDGCLRDISIELADFLDLSTS